MCVPTKRQSVFKENYSGLLKKKNKHCVAERATLGIFQRKIKNVASGEKHRYSGLKIEGRV